MSKRSEAVWNRESLSNVWSNMRTVLAVPLLLVVSLAFACGGGDAPADPTATPAVTELPDGDEAPELDDPTNAPPSLTVTAGAASIEAGLGSFCYGSLCADAIGYVTPVQALPAVGVDLLEATLSAETVGEVVATATDALSLESQEICTVVDGIEPGGPLCNGDGEWLAWTGALGEGEALSTAVSGASFVVDTSSLAPRNYVVTFFVRFAGGGDASYGVLLDTTAAGAATIGPFFVIEDDGLEFDEVPTVCEAESVDDGSLLAGTPFESRRFPDFTTVYRCVDDGRVTAAVVRSSPSFRRYEFTGLAVVEWPGGEAEYSRPEIDGMDALLAVQTVPGVEGHEAAIYVIEERPDGDAPGRMAELRFVSAGGAVCFMRQILDLDAPGPCAS